MNDQLRIPKHLTKFLTSPRGNDIIPLSPDMQRPPLQSGVSLLVPFPQVQVTGLESTNDHAEAESLPELGHEAQQRRNYRALGEAEDAVEGPVPLEDLGKVGVGFGPALVHCVVPVRA